MSSSFFPAFVGAQVSKTGSTLTSKSWTKGFLHWWFVIQGNSDLCGRLNHILYPTENLCPGPWKRGI